MSIAYPPDLEQSIYPELLAKVQTIGYRQPNALEEIEERMQADPSTILVDIRLSPRSQNLQWTKTAFSKKYKKRYIWIKQLGNVNHNKNNAPIEILDPQTGIEQLIALLQDHNVLLLCGCEDYEKCHRKVVYELLKSALNVEASKATCFSAKSPGKQIVFTRTEEEYQMLARMMLDQEEQLTRLKDYDTEQREIIGRLTEKRARTYRIINSLRHRNQQTRTQIQERYHCSIEELVNGSSKMIPATTLNREQERRTHAEQRLKQLRESPFKPTERLIIDELQYQLNNPNAYKDQDGYNRVCYETTAKHVNMSASTPKRAIEAIAKQWPEVPVSFKWGVPERTADGREIERLYIKSDVPNLVTAAMNANLTETKIKQGGDHTICAHCGGKHVHRDIIKKVLLVCDDCGHKSILEEETVTIDYPNASYTKQDAAKRKANVCNLQANIITSNPPSVCVENNIPVAAKLLLAIAGTHDQHIEMSRTGEKKYYSVDRPLSLADLESHLQGGQARGALCSHPNGQTRALCFDADDIEDWTVLQDAAKRLAEHEYLPLLEESPADRGGHLWLIFDNMVNGDAARERAYQIAPDLRKIVEYWPAPASAKNWNRVRLPGAFYSRSGKYVEHPVRGWCKIVNVATGESSHDGATAAALLLASLTSIAVMITTIQEQDTPPTIEEKPQTIIVETTVKPDNERGYRLPEVDEKWEAKNGKITETKLYFAIMPQYAADWFNERNSLESIRPLEHNKMALSPNGNERTASTDYHTTADGERYTDHSTHGMRPDGTKDTGDALELAAKVQGVSKSSLLYETTKQISAQARAELESAANAGKPIPVWLEEPVCIITPAGRKRHAYLLKQLAKRIDTDIEQHFTEFVQQEEIKPILVELGKAIEAEQPTERVSDYPHLKIDMRVNTPAGMATITNIIDCPILKRPRCSVHTVTTQPNGSRFAAFNLSEVTPISQQTLL